MKKAASEPFKFGQSKTSKKTYFPARIVRPSGTTAMAAAAPEERPYGRTSKSNPVPEK